MVSAEGTKRIYSELLLSFLNTFLLLFGQKGWETFRNLLLLSSTATTATTTTAAAATATTSTATATTATYVLRRHDEKALSAFRRKQDFVACERSSICASWVALRC